MQRLRTLLTGVALAMTLGTVPAAAQQSQPADSATRPSAMATRQELQTALQRAKPGSDEAVMLQRRLEQGDVMGGDRIVLYVAGEEALADTFTVRPGQMLSLPEIPKEIPLKGVLRSELQSYLTQEIGRYIRNPRVDAEALMRVAVLGAVNQPGFYNVPATTPISQVVMVAGGLGGDADVNKTQVKRTGTTIYGKDQVKTALAQGASLDQMNLNSGDEIVVGRSGGLMKLLPVIGALSGIIGITIALTRGGR